MRNCQKCLIAACSIPLAAVVITSGGASRVIGVISCWSCIDLVVITFDHWRHVTELYQSLSRIFNPCALIRICFFLFVLTATVHCLASMSQNVLHRDDILFDMRFVVEVGLDLIERSLDRVNPCGVELFILSFPLVRRATCNVSIMRSDTGRAPLSKLLNKALLTILFLFRYARSLTLARFLLLLSFCHGAASATPPTVCLCSLSNHYQKPQTLVNAC